MLIEPGQLADSDGDPQLPLLSPVDAPAGWYVVPILARHTPVGTLAIATSRHWTTDDEITAEHFGTVIAVAVENLRLARVEHELTLNLQRSLLPSGLPSAAGISIEARYTPSDRHAEVGGDFYDAVLLDDGRLAVAIGDVQGHSLTAAAVMAELRYSARALMAEGHSLSHVLDRLNAIMLDEHADMIATLCLILVATDRSSFELANAGHLPPLYCGGDDVRPVGKSGALLGVHARPRPTTTHELALGDSLLLFTDGLVERRDEDIDQGVERITGILRGGWMSSDDLLDRMLQTAAGHGDDIAVVHVSRTGDAAAT
jgi:serine phosphatase RsbU (regulator of sigma subunit)